MFISEAMAQAADAAAATSQGTLTGTLIQLGLIFVIFYVILIRPQQKRMKEHDNLLASIKKGDRLLPAAAFTARLSKQTKVRNWSLKSLKASTSLSTA